MSLSPTGHVKGIIYNSSRKEFIRNYKKVHKKVYITYTTFPDAAMLVSRATWEASQLCRSVEFHFREHNPAPSSLFSRNTKTVVEETVVEVKE